MPHCKLALSGLFMFFSFITWAHEAEEKKSYSTMRIVGEPPVIDGLLNDEYFDTEILFTSPSGDGLKWIVSIDITEHGHKDWFTSIKNYIQEAHQLDVDSAGKDVSRACFLPHDANIYLHPKYRN